jgi:hypothetical protein
VLGSHFCGGGGLEDRLGRHALRRYDRLHFRPTEGEGAGLVENDRIDPAQALKIEAALDDGAEPRRPADAAQDRQRRAGGNPTGASDDHNRDGRAHVARDQEGECRGTEGEVN